jgi:hypothetical protein
VEGPFKVRFEVWDQDGTTQSVAQQVTVGAPPESGWTTPFWIQMGSQSLNITTGGGPSWAQFQVETEPVTPTIVFDMAATTTFAPTVGERAWIKGRISHPSRLRITVGNASGAVQVVEGPFRQIFNVDWDGRDTNRNPMAPGQYTVTVTDVSAAPGTTAAQATWPLTLEPPPSPRLRIDGFTPAREDGWDFSAGPLTINASASSSGRPAFTASPGRCPDNAAPLRTVTLDRRVPGPFQYDWDGLDDYGSPAGTGWWWCLRLSGTSDQGPYVAAEQDVMLLTPPVGLKVITSAFPVAPALDPSTPPEIRAFVVDGQHKDRYAFSLSLTLAPAAAVGASTTFAPVTLRGTCSRASKCAWPIPAALRGAAIAWSVTVSTAPDWTGATLSATTGFRITDLVATAAAVRVDVPANVVPPIVGPGFIAQSPTSATLDVALFPGTGLAPGDPTGGAAFLGAVERAVNELRGFGDGAFWRFKSTAEENWSSVAVWAVPSPVTVLSDGGGLCSISATPGDSFAEAVAVLHGVACRDNAPGRQFSAHSHSSGIFWHELHHSAYDEMDEYCCDGGYEDGVNVYRDQNSCLYNSSVGSTCHEIEGRDPVTGMPVTNGWWASDSAVWDVMVSNRLENPDDRRAARWTFDRCRRGACGW